MEALYDAWRPGGCHDNGEVQIYDRVPEQFEENLMSPQREVYFNNY